MERRINRLDEIIANKIAAGEVVDRPASVIKELVENSIDAKSNKITVEIKNAGKSYIRISDNGIGIHPDDVEVAFERHATSKIRKVEDLSSILSLGFRGEALASIAAVSQLELITKSKDHNVGRKVVVHGGKLISNDEVGAPGGTTILVKNLFYNVPARFEFMKSNGSETSYIIDIVSKLALAYPNISFRLINNDKVVFVTNGNGHIVNNIASIYGKDIAKNLIEVEEKVDNIIVKGFLCKPSVTRGNKKLQTFFVNQRYIKSKTISEAVSDAYKTLITINRHAICFVYVHMNPNLIDINIHPAKTEIRFKDDENVKKGISYVLKKGLFSKSLIPQIREEEKIRKEAKINIINTPIIKSKIENPKNISNMIKKEEPKKNIINPIKNIKEVNITPILQENEIDKVKTMEKNIIEPEIIVKEEKVKYEPILEKENSLVNHVQVIEKEPEVEKLIEKNIEENIKEKLEENMEKEILPTIFMDTHKDEIQESFIEKNEDETILDIRIIGQLFNSYLIGQGKDKMYLVDQHAAHERILYEWFLKKYKSQNPLTQKLLVPILVEFSIYEYETIKEFIHVFENLGYELEDFGQNTFRITSVPVIFGKPEAESFFKEVAESFKHISSSYDAKIEKVISMACKNAIKANDKLMDMEIERLMDELSKADNPYTCPHGRPIVISMTKYEIERKFKRK
ncbi:MAG: DNA mismatch repair endonuclease MutL [Anaeromicrobium sp.]|jgi:DNA mismatch repair protein MutL|uniref:DNA mismatch repair endonuclease MutL n=1 Tax=Anaeromicrobium sp. TaxID=1929132 RepID=UPI0025F30B10|nr:DNA mismatch repair endonuclease MutL [Anaeromicrobium sp.]MCT4594719.1 DNA mismatch repair endonuclease MutL [Anaeromicrobium sp.]